MGAETLDFNKTVLKEQAASEGINAVINAQIRKQNDDQERRTYLGASVIGKECTRALQFELAGAPKEKGFGDLTLRKFQLGHVGEEIAREWFWRAGFDLVQKNQRTGQPFRFMQLNERFAGTPDGVFIKGPAIEGVGYPCLWEAKSVGNKTFNEIKKHGLKKSRPTYYAQVAIYQAYLNLTDHPCIFTVTNLDSGDQLHLLIPFDAEEAQRMTDRAVQIVSATDAGELLPRPFPDAEYYVCKFCDFAKRCWGLEQ